VAAVKYVSEVFAELDDLADAEDQEADELKEWACDLDWEQPDPFSSGTSVFASDDGYCSTQCEVVLFKVRSPSQGRKAIQQFVGDDLHENRFSNIMVACTYASSRFYCAAIFADVRQARAIIPPPFSVCHHWGTDVSPVAGAGRRLRVVLLARCLRQVKRKREEDGDYKPAAAAAARGGWREEAGGRPDRNYLMEKSEEKSKERGGTHSQKKSKKTESVSAQLSKMEAMRLSMADEASTCDADEVREGGLE
jgi:hypothetical protein